MQYQKLCSVVGARGFSLAYPGIGVAASRNVNGTRKLAGFAFSDAPIIHLLVYSRQYDCLLHCAYQRGTTAAPIYCARFPRSLTTVLRTLLQNRSHGTHDHLVVVNNDKRVAQEKAGYQFFTWFEQGAFVPRASFMALAGWFIRSGIDPSEDDEPNTETQ